MYLQDDFSYVQQSFTLQFLLSVRKEMAVMFWSWSGCWKNRLWLVLLFVCCIRRCLRARLSWSLLYETMAMVLIINQEANLCWQSQCEKVGTTRRHKGRGFLFVVVIIVYCLLLLSIVCCLVLECKSNQSKWLPGLELSERMTERAERRQGFSTDWSVWSFSKWTKTPSQWGRSIEASKQK